jgi:hypothetical protein
MYSSLTLLQGRRIIQDSALLGGFYVSPLSRRSWPILERCMVSPSTKVE